MPTPADVHKRYVETSRGLVHLQEAGIGQPALILVTLTSFSAPLLDTVLPALAKSGWHAIALDLMGYGRSDKRDTHWLVEDFADNIVETVRACDVEPLGLACGHFSSWVGIEIAGRMSASGTAEKGSAIGTAERRPAAGAGLPCLRGLAIDGTPYFDAQERAIRLAAGLPQPEHWDAQGSHALAYWMKVWRILHQLDPDRLLPQVPTERFRNAVMALMEASVYEPNTALAAASYEIERKLPLVAMPTLVMCSDTDWNLPRHDRVVAALPQPTSVRLAGVNPLHAIDAPERGADYAALLHAFFAPLRDSIDVSGSTL